MVGFGRFREGFGRLRKVLVSFWKVLEGFGRLCKVLEFLQGFGRFWKVLEGLGRFGKVLGRFGKVSEGILSKNPSEIKSPKVSDSKIKKSVKNAADSSGQIQKKTRFKQKTALIFLIFRG